MTSGGVVDITSLLLEMSPELDESGTYVFATVPSELLRDHSEFIWATAVPATIASFREDEGLTLILPESVFRSGMINETPIPAPITSFWNTTLGPNPPQMQRITMKVHSSLTAVGFTAAFSKVLTEAHISCNVFAGYFHDHIFVPANDASKAMGVLTQLSAQS